MTTISTINVPTKANPVATDTVVGSSAVDSTTCKMTVLSVRQRRYPEDYGAVGDDATDDTTALINCMAPTVDKVVAFQPGKTYLYSGSIPVYLRTVIEGNGAMLKRRAGTSLVSTTLTEIAASAPAGSTVRVADPSKFAVNMNVSFDDGAPDVTGPTFSNECHKITDITGDVLTLATAFAAGVTFSIGSYIRMSTMGLVLGADCKVRDVIFDGNRDNNLIGAAKWGYWIHHSEVGTSSHRCVIENCEIKNGQSEGIAANYHAMIIRDNYIHDCAGNAVHLSGGNGTRIIGNRFYNNNLLMGPGTLLTTNTGHNDGHISFSALIDRTVITDNQFEDTNNYGIGSVNGASDNSNIVVANNFFINCVKGPMQINQTVENILFNGNQIKDCGLFDIDDTSSALAIQWISILNNQFHNSALRLDYVNHPVVVGNSFNCPLIATPLVLANCSVDAINEHNLVVALP